MSSWDHLAFITSEDSGQEYELKRQRATGRLGCSCTAYRFAPGRNKTCKHIEAFSPGINGATATDADRAEVARSIASQRDPYARLRREIRDKLEVARSCHDARPHSGIVMRQCEDYLVDLVRTGGAAYIDQPSTADVVTIAGEVFKVRRAFAFGGLDGRG